MWFQWICLLIVFEVIYLEVKHKPTLSQLKITHKQQIPVNRHGREISPDYSRVWKTLIEASLWLEYHRTLQ